MMTALAIWTIVGVVMLMYLPEPETKLEVWLALFVSGPIGWVIFFVILFKIMTKP